MPKSFSDVFVIVAVLVSLFLLVALGISAESLPIMVKSWSSQKCLYVFDPATNMNRGCDFIAKGGKYDVEWAQ